MHRLPEFIIIGSPKCATSTLAATIDYLPNFSYGFHKEPKILCKTQKKSVTIKQYDYHFRKKSEIYFDASTDYTKLQKYPKLVESFFF